MNSYKTEGDATITDADLHLAFPNARLSIEPTMITTTQHCEVTIALAAPPTEIGISKHSCWLCEVFFRCLESKLGYKFRITGYQGNVHPGWHYPVEAGQAIRNALLEILHKELGELRGMADPRRRSDSFPVSSPDDWGGEVNREKIRAIEASRAAKKTRTALNVRNL